MSQPHISYCQYLQGPLIGYWRYVLIYRKPRFETLKHNGEAIFSKIVRSKNVNRENFREHRSLIRIYHIINRTSGTIVSKPPRGIEKHARAFEIGTKRGIYSDFQRHEARPIYCDILDPIYRPPESGIVLGGLLSGYCQ